MKNKIGKIILQLLLVVLFVFPNFATAESLDLRTAKTSYRVGDSFEVSVVVDAGSNSINTISGKISIPTDFFNVSNLRYGNSIVTLWVEKPTIVNGQISFAGGIPGGFNSKTGQVLTFSLKAKKVGSASITTNDVSLLLNDGFGTPLSGLTPSNLRLTIIEALPPQPITPKKDEEKQIIPEPKVEVYVPPADTNPPEGFIPLISQHPNIADSKYFVSFSAVDKGSGISHYEVKEIPQYLPFWETEWEISEGLYILKNQLWMTRVVIRAFDQEGNYIDGEAYKPIDPTLAGLISIVVAGLILHVWRLSTVKPTKSKGRMLK